MRFTIKILKKKKVLAAILIYIVFLLLILYAYSGSPSKDEITVYKGIYTTIFPSSLTMDAMVEDGMNTVCIAVSYPVDSNGNIHTIPFIEKIKIAQIQSAYRKSLRVFLVVEPFTFGERGGPTLPQSVKNDPKLLEGFLKQYNPLVLKWAEIAEKYGVELFTPMNEFDYSLGSIEKASDWGREILPKIKDRYRGKIVWKGSLNYAPPKEFARINFAGYDYIGFSISPHASMTLEEYPQFVDTVLNATLTWAERDNCKGVLVTEFGTWEWKPEHSEEDVARAHEIVLEEGKNKAVGFFITDAPEFLAKELGGRPLKGSLKEQTIKEWFKERLP